ncbi:MAG: flavodoxin family protein [Synergistaceae bacterium]|jgi:multimeric flavodoxin WrbA|nr:flavodoxin family protein [Synergistaceae bacterium]
MKILAVNGSPRKGWNTSKLLEHALEGAKSVGGETEEIVNLYDLNFRGCVSCFRCRVKEGGHPGRCAVRDDLSSILDRMAEYGGLLIGSPIYLWDVTSQTRAFLERLIYSNLAYRAENRSEYKGKTNAGFIYSMNATEERMKTSGYDFLFKSHMHFLSFLNGRARYMTSNDTWQFDDYAKYDVPLFDPAAKAEVRREQFPKDCKRAFEIGAGLVQSRR